MHLNRSISTNCSESCTCLRRKGLRMTRTWSRRILLITEKPEIALITSKKTGRWTHKSKISCLRATTRSPNLKFLCPGRAPTPSSRNRSVREPMRSLSKWMRRTNTFSPLWLARLRALKPKSFQSQPISLNPSLSNFSSKGTSFCRRFSLNWIKLRNSERFKRLKRGSFLANSMTNPKLGAPKLSQKRSR